MIRRVAWLLLACALALGRAPAQEPVLADAKSPRVFCVSREGLAEAKARIARDDPETRAALRRLVQEADQALDVGPYAVVLKGRVPPSGNKHDYLSIAPYSWPDPAKPDGLPYVNRDGLTNPEWRLDYDRVPLERLTQATETLALAYALTARDDYASQAARLVRVWFLDPGTAMTPDLAFAQGTPGVNTGGTTQVIDTRFLPRIVDAIGLLDGSKAWTERDQSGMVAWCREFLANIRRRYDAGYRTSPTNIASFHHVEVASLALFVGDETLARDTIERTKSRLALAVGDDGFFTAERNRTRSLSYSSFHLYALFNLATMGRLVGVDLWHFAPADGRSLRRALDVVAAHAGPYPPPRWPFKEIGHTKSDWWDPFIDQLPVVLHHAAVAYGEKSYDEQAAQILSGKDALAANRIHLMCGLPLPGQQSLCGALFHPSSLE